MYGDKIQFCEQRDDALKNAHALAIMTEWNVYRRPDWDEVMALMKTPTVFDGRNLFEPERMRERGFQYYSIGRPTV